MGDVMSLVPYRGEMTEYNYLSSISHFPILTQSEEYEAAKAWAKDSDIKAAHKLVTSHLRLVYKIAMQFKGYGLVMMDVISEGNMGLMHAVKKFDPEMGNRFSTYAIWWIKAAIQDYILRSWSIVKSANTAIKKKLFFNLQKVKNKILNIHGGRLPHNASTLIAEELDVKKSDIESMESYMKSNESLNRPVCIADSTRGEAIDYIVESSNDQEEVVMQLEDNRNTSKLVSDAIAILDDREKDIIKSRVLTDGKSVGYKVLADKYSISAERVRQIQNNALEKLKRFIEAQDKSVC